MKKKLKCVQPGLMSIMVAGMLILPTGAFANSQNGDKQPELLSFQEVVTNNVEAKVDSKVDSKVEVNNSDKLDVVKDALKKVEINDTDKQGDSKINASLDFKAKSRADLVTVKPLEVNANGKIKFQCVNHGSEPVTLKYSLTGLKKELKLAANETKMIEVDGKGRALLDLWVDDVAKGSIEATIENTSSAESKADLVTVKPLAASAIGKLRFECQNHGSEPITVKYALAGSDLKKDIVLAANETKIIDIEANGNASLNTWVNDVAKNSVAGITASSDADLITVKPLVAHVNGKLRFECENHGSQPMTVKYALAGSDLKKDFVLAANETKVIELDSTGNGSLDLWVNDIAKPSVAGITVSSTADLVIVKPLPVLEVGKIRFQYENHASEPVTVKYALAGSDLKKEVVLAANETQIIEIPSTGNASLELWVNEVAKTPVEANTDISILNPNVTPDSDTNPSETGTNPDTSSGTSPDTSGGTDSGTPQNTGTLPANQTPNSENAANGANGAQPGSGVLVGDTSSNSNPTYVAGVSDESVAGYDQLPQTGEKFPWNYYLIGTLMVLFGVMSVLKFRRNQ